MTEEEKKAIEELRLFEYKYVLKDNDDKKIETILNLIEKQQNKIYYYEDLLSALDTYYAITIENIQDCIKNDK